MLMVGQNFFLDFLPYGADAGDASMTLTGTEILGPLHLSSPIVLYNKLLRSLYVCVPNYG